MSDIVFVPSDAIIQREDVLIQQVIESYEKYGEDMLFVKKLTATELAKVKQYDCNWIKLYIKLDTTTYSLLKLKFEPVVISSGARQFVSDKNNLDVKANNKLQFNIVSIDLNSLHGLFYSPREFKSAAKQEKENARVLRNNSKYVRDTNNLFKSLEYIDKSFKILISKLQQKGYKKELGVAIKKGQNIHSCLQYTRNDEDLNEEVKLEKPIARIKIPHHKDTGLIGNYYGKKNSKGEVEINPSIYDMNHYNDKTRQYDVATVVDDDGNKVPLNTDNTPAFITKRSLITGVFHTELCVSSLGLSLQIKVYSITVRHYEADINTTVSVDINTHNKHMGNETFSDDDDDEDHNKLETPSFDDDDDDLTI